MTHEKRPEWVEKAAVAVAALYGAKHIKEGAEASEEKLKTEMKEKIAGVIHQHFQEHK